MSEFYCGDYYTDYYKNFRCIGPACEDTCCAVWEIRIDSKTYKKYRSLKGTWGRRFAEAIDRDRHCFRLNGKRGKRCVFLTKGRLCRIHAELGEEYLCRECRIFPRHKEDYGERREYMLSLACPEAARLLLYKTDQTRLVRAKRDEGRRRKSPGGDGMCDKERLMALLCLRENMLGILHKDSLDITIRAGMLLALAHDVQRPFWQGRWEIVAKKAAFYAGEAAAGRFCHILGLLPREPERVQRARYLDMLEGFQVSDSRFLDMLKETQKLFSEESDSSYKQLLEEFMQAEADTARQKLYENLLEYFLITYLLGAVYDRDVYDKVKFSVFSMCMIREFYLMQYRKSRSVENIDRTGPAVRYSRELENNSYNLEALEAVLRERKEFSLKELLLFCCASEYRAGDLGGGLS